MGPAEGLFTTDFLRRCHRILRPGGVMVQQSESPLYHSGSIIRELRRDMREAGFGSVATLPFPQPVYPSGWWSVTLAGKGCEVNDFRERDAREADLPLDYYTAEIHRGAWRCRPSCDERSTEPGAAGGIAIVAARGGKRAPLRRHPASGSVHRPPGAGSMPAGRRGHCR